MSPRSAPGYVPRSLAESRLGPYASGPIAPKPASTPAHEAVMYFVIAPIVAAIVVCIAFGVIA